MEQQQLYKDILRKFNIVLNLSSEINKELSKKLLLKQQALGLQLTQDLKDKCHSFLVEQNAKNQFQCKFCLKKFDDGRKLGGHVSRAHKASPRKQHLKTRKRHRKSRRLHEDSSDMSEVEVKMQEK